MHRTTLTIGSCLALVIALLLGTTQSSNADRLRSTPAAALVSGTGHGAWNGPDPLAIDTTGTGGSYSLRDPNRFNLLCKSYRTGNVYTKSVNDWGDGNPTRLETACVDAMWAAQKQFDMFRNWLGRNGQNAQGGAWPLRVGLPDVGLYWNSTSKTIDIGHTGPTYDTWVTQMDLVGREYGHAVDETAPGWPFRDPGLAEGFADIMGTLTEAYANEPLPYDEPDYLIGEKVNLLGTGPLRFMYDPSLAGHENCYSSAIPTMEEYRASGVLNHWFYLLAEGSSPGGGKPTSPTCNNSTVTGVGIRMAGKVVHQALQMRVKGTGYGRERLLTLAAAKQLDPTCVVFRATQAAWNAVRVPVGPDPLCP
ncbi:M4 family metallopeptidase [Embleya scabrispora]|nr:M4 family metallopeptidase [Embleya scabrispora]